MKKTALLFKALGDPLRLEIINLLLGRELCVCDIFDTFHVSQPSISHHLKILKQAGLVDDKREGKWIYYSLNNETMQQLVDITQGIIEKSTEKRRIRLFDNEKCTNAEYADTKCSGGNS